MEARVGCGRLPPELVGVVRDLLRDVVAANPDVAVTVESFDDAGLASGNLGLLITAVDLGIEIRVEVRDDLTVAIGASTTGQVKGAEVLLPMARAAAQMIERTIAISVARRLEVV